MPVPPVIQMYRYVMGSGGGLGNLLKASEEFQQTVDWVRYPSDSQTPTVNANSRPDPNGGTTADQVGFTANTSARLQQTVTLSASTQYTFSVYARAVSGSVDFRMRNVTLKAAEVKTATTTGGDGGGFTRFTYTFTTTTEGSYELALQNDTNATAKDVIFWGAMLNQGGTAANYEYAAPTTGGSAPAPAYAGFGDAFGGVTAYYSLRQFTEAETLNAIRVRRSSDDTEQDIGFDGEGNLDTTALLAFVNSGEVFTNPNITSATGWVIAANTTYNASSEAFDLVGENGLTVRQGKNVNGHTFAITIVLDSVTSGGIKIYAGGTQSAVISTAGTHTLNIVGGASNNILGINPNGSVTCSISSFSAIDTTADGFVTKWYDQSGNSNDAINADASEQPLVVSGGTLVTENGKAAIDFDGVDDYFTGAVKTTMDNTAIFAVIKSDSNTQDSVFIQNTLDASNLVALGLGAGGALSRLGSQLRVGGSDVVAVGDNTFTATDQTLVSYLADTTSAEIHIDGVQETNITLSRKGGSNTTIGARGDANYPFNGAMQEVIFFDSDQSTNRTGMETNINDHFDIYTP